MKTTIKDIAKMAQVSTTTVSKILNNNFEGMTVATKTRVLETIREMNYKPSVIARSLVTNHTRTLGLTLPSIANPFFSNLARGVEDYAVKNGYNLFLCNTDDDREKQKIYFDALIEKSVDGIISATYCDDQEEYFDAIIQKKVPLIMLDRYFDNTEMYQLSIDNYGGIYHAVKYLFGRGHRRIACIRGPQNMPFCRERLRGYREAFRDANLNIDENLIFEGDFTIDSGAEIATAILQQHAVTAIVCFNDFMAYGVYKACRKLNKMIPKDVSVIGFDDIELSTIIEPQLTTVRQPIYEMGIKAAEMIIGLIENKPPQEKRVKLETLFIERKSVMDKTHGA